MNAAVAAALKLKDVYCLHELVHNEIIVGELKSLGYRFVEDISEVPRGARVVISAHGIPPEIRERAKERQLELVDLTCPYVLKAHSLAREASLRGDRVVVLGDRDHVEVRGILGEISASADGSSGKTAVVCQTTLNADAARGEVDRLAQNTSISEVSWPCSATSERQQAVRDFCRRNDCASKAVLVLGSRSSANARRLAGIAAEEGVKSFMAGTADEVHALKDELSMFEVVGVTSGASTPERFYVDSVKCLSNIPVHLAMIMDGNGRWAQQRGKSRGEGHAAGAQTLMKVMDWCEARGIRYVSVYAFSTENWRRGEEEVAGLMRLFAALIKSQRGKFIEKRIRFRVVGRRGDLSPSLQKAIAALEEDTAHFERQLILCVSYGGRAEIVDAVNRAIAAGQSVTEETFREFLYAPDVPDPDLIIRTSGEMRISNFLLWESAYAEYFFTPVLWPDFSESNLDAALADYSGRNRRHGGVK